MIERIQLKSTSAGISIHLDIQNDYFYRKRIAPARKTKYVIIILIDPLQFCVCYFAFSKRSQPFSFMQDDWFLASL